MKQNTLKVAFGGMAAALALVFMMMTALIPAGTYVLPCLAGIVLVAIVIEFGHRWALLSYAAIAVLSLFLAADKEASIYFVAFFGFYPILKSAIERLRSAALQYLLKYAVFTVCIVAAFFVCKFVLMIPDEEFTIGGFYIPWAFLIAGEVMFWFYDKCITILLTHYIVRLRGMLFRGKNNRF